MGPGQGRKLAPARCRGCAETHNIAGENQKNLCARQENTQKRPQVRIMRETATKTAARKKQAGKQAAGAHYARPGARRKERFVSAQKISSICLSKTRNTAILSRNSNPRKQRTTVTRRSRFLTLLLIGWPMSTALIGRNSFVRFGPVAIMSAQIIRILALLWIILPFPSCRKLCAFLKPKTYASSCLPRHLPFLALPAVAAPITPAVCPLLMQTAQLSLRRLFLTWTLCAFGAARNYSKQ